MARLRRCTSVALVALMLAGGPLQGCGTWRAQPPVPAAIGTSEPNKVRVTLQSGEHVIVYSPYFAGDSLVGTELPPHVSRPGTGRRIALPLDQIRLVEVRKISGVRTTLLVVGIAAALLAIAAASYANSSSSYASSCAEPSCPFLYSWDGREWRLDSGTFGGAILKALARTDVDNLEHATARDGTLRLKLANELDETDYVDLVQVLAVDHERGVAVAPDAEGRLHTLSRPQAPVIARDLRDRDVLAPVGSRDGWCWESVPTIRDAAADIRDGLELAFVRPPGATQGRLVVDGNNTVWAAHLLKVYLAAHGRATAAWYDSLERDPGRARALGERLAREGFLEVQLHTGAGWERRGLIWEAGPEVMKRQVMALDLSGCEGDTVRIRLESVPCFWQIDHVALDCAPDRAVAVTEMGAARAVDRNGVDVLPLLSGIDGRVYEMKPGDHAELRFEVPPVPRGRARSYVARTHGWYRVHTDESGESDRALLAGVMARPQGVSRSAVEMTNRVLRQLEERAR